MSLVSCLENTQKIQESQMEKTLEDISNPLFQMELKFDSLKNYVDSVTNAVNQHAVLINKLRSEMTMRVNEQNVIIELIVEG